MTSRVSLVAHFIGRPRTQFWAREASMEDMDEVIAAQFRGAQLVREAVYAECQLHGAHGLLSKLLSFLCESTDG